MVEVRLSKDFYQSYEYWFENEEQLNQVSNYDENYYLYRIFRDVICQLDLPSGKIVLLGTHRCVSFNLLCDHFGFDSCLGFDLYNPVSHPKVIVRDCSTLNEQDNMPIAFGCNDVGNFPKTYELKLHAQKWLASNIVLDGVMLSRNNKNSRKIDLEGLMEDYGFENLPLADLDTSKYDLKNLSPDELETHMLCIRRRIGI